MLDMNESFWLVSTQATDVVADEWKWTLQLQAAFCYAEKKLNSISLFLTTLVYRK